MDKPDFPEKQTTWTTWEELLLACAVHRYGTQSWDSVAAQLRKRCSNLHHLSPHSCQLKFLDLRRRFHHPNDAVCDGDNDEDKSSLTPWLDQLRQLRLDELRQEVQRRDVSIVSLQLKVEKLKEVREKSDLEKSGEEQQTIDKSVLPENIWPENVAEKEVSGEAFGRNDGRSSNESNTTDPKLEILDAAEEAAGPVEPAAVEVGATAEKSSNPVVVEDSCNGSSDSVVKEPEPPVAESEKASSGELRDSRSCSEVQSTASLSRKSGPELKASEPVELDQEDQSPAMNHATVESQPLVDFLRILRSHKSASFFERRLQSQDTPIYTNMIRQHTDFESVQTRLNAGWYSSCKSKFFRDVLLICKNAIVFFGKRSPEYQAACELQLLILKEMACKDPNQDPSPKQDTHTPSKEEAPTPPVLPLKPEAESSESLLTKSKLAIPLTACRKRSSIKARSSTTSSAPDIKKEQKTTSLHDVKPAIFQLKKEESLDEAEEQPPVTKKRRKERVGSNSRNNLNKNSKGRSDANKEKNPDATANVASSTRALISNENSENVGEMERKTSNNTSGKRQSAEKFLSRMKRGSASNNKSDTLKIPENDSKDVTEQRKNGNGKGNGQKAAEQRKNGNGKGSAQEEVGEQKKSGNGRGSAQKEQASRKGSGGRQAAKEQGSPSKRSVGRPSKRAAETTRATPAKRRR